MLKFTIEIIILYCVFFVYIIFFRFRLIGMDKFLWNYNKVLYFIIALRILNQFNNHIKIYD